MATDSQSTEKIVLKLETDFAEVLKNAAAQYSRFVRKTGDSVKGLGGTFDNLAKQVSTSVDHMFDATNKSIQGSLGKARIAFKQVADQGIDVIDRYTKSIDKLTTKQKSLNKELAKVEASIAKQQGIINTTDNKLSKQVAQKLLDAGQSKKEALSKELQKELQRINNEYNRMMSELAAASNKGLAKQTSTATSVIRNTAKDATVQVEKLRKELDRLTQVKGLQTLGKSMEKVRMKDMDSALAAQRQRLNEAKRNMELNVQSLSSIRGDDALKSDARKNLLESVKDLRKVREGYVQLQEEVRDYERLMRKTQQSSREMAVEFQKALSRKINLGTIRQSFKTLDDQLTAYGRSAGEGFQKGMTDAIQKSAFAEKSLDSKIAKLKELRKQAETLGKTGLVDTKSEVAKIDAVIAEYNKFWSQFKAQQKNIQSILKGSAGLVDIKGTSELNTLSKQYNELAKSAKQYGKVSKSNFLEVNENLKKSQQLHDRYLRKYEMITVQIKAAEEKLQAAIIAQTKETNKERIAQYDSLINKIRSKIAQVKDSMAKSFIDPQGIDRQFREVEKMAERTQQVIRRTFAKQTMPREEFARVNKQFRELQSITNKLSQKRFINVKHLGEADDKMKELEKSTRIYAKRLQHAQEQLKKLNQIQKSGLATPGIQAQAEALDRQINKMKQYSRTLSNHYRTSSNEMDKLHKKASKSFVSNAWESIRNFRWQVAAVIYLISRAVMTVQRTVLAVLNNIQKFRMDAMSLAASFSMQMIGGIEDTYERAYQFSRDLMVKLEMQAAKTILTVEDMLMLTKTFAQAGIIPKTDDDVRNIATIGTAIKALTEGMANAGVQMRQELYALIAGRQRATDQLAMMFKFIGIDIQKVIDDAKKQGVSMIEALGMALRPFDEMNRRMEREFSAVINRLKAIWGLIQRIGSEYTLIDISDKLFNLAESLAKVTDDGLKLTKRGEEVATALAMGMEMVQQIAMTTWDMIKAILNSLGMIGNLFNSIFGGVSEHAHKLEGNMKTVAVIFESVMKLLGIIRMWFTAITVATKTWSLILKVVANTVMGIGKIFGGILTGQISMIKEGSKQLIGAFKGVTDQIVDIYDTAVSIPGIWDDTKTAIDNAYTALDRVVKKQAELGDLLTIPHTFGKMSQNLQKLETSYKEFKKAGASGEEKIQIQYEIDTENFDLIKEQLRENIEASEAALRKVGKAGVGRNEGDEFIINSRIQAWREYLEKIEKVEVAAAEKRRKALSDLHQKQLEDNARMERQFTMLLIELDNRPETRSEKTAKWKSTMLERIRELSKTNEYVKANEEAVRKALDLGFMRRQIQDAREYREELEALFTTINSHEVATPFEKLNTEMDKLTQKIKANEELSQDDKLSALQAVMNAKKERIEILKINQAREVALKQMDAQASYANLLKNNYSPIKQAEGEMVELTTQRQRAAIKLKAELEEINKMHKDEQGMWKKGSENMAQYSQALIDEYRHIQTAFEDELWKKQHPLWNDMMEMSKNWADGLSDSLTDLVLDFENFGESIKALWQSIIRDVVKASIKRLIIDKMMDQLGSGQSGIDSIFGGKEAGKETGAAAVAAGAAGMMADQQKAVGGLDQLIASGNPVPVIIVGQAQSMQSEVVNAVQGTTQAVTENTEETSNAFTEGIGKIGTWFTDMFSNIGTTLSNAGSSVAGWFSGGSGGSSGGGFDWGSIIGLASTAATYDNGGMITEPVVGAGMRTGKTYEFAKNGKSEMVTPVSEWAKNIQGGESYHFSMPLNLNALDTRTGVEFIMRNQSVIENGMVKSMRNNKSLRGMMRRTY